MSLWASRAITPSDGMLEYSGRVYHHKFALRNCLVHPGFIHLYFLVNLINHLFCPHVLFLKQIQVLHKAILSRNCCTWIMWTGFPHGQDKEYILQHIKMMM